MRLMVGLGNPGADHARQRHNFGFVILERIVGRYGFSGWQERMHGLISDGRYRGEKILALKPQTYMNNSGYSVGTVARFFKLEVERIVVFHDEIDLPLGKVRIKRGGGTAGHRGLHSLDEHIGPDYWRVRLGIGRPENRSLVRDYVLQNFAPAEREQSEKLCEACVTAWPLLIENQHSCFLSRIAVAMEVTQTQDKPGQAS